jgi:hypothetical protein
MATTSHTLGRLILTLSESVYQEDLEILVHFVRRSSDLLDLHCLNF